MKFTSGRHLTNYILKIFRNNNIDIPIENIGIIKDLSHIFTFIENLPNKVKENIDIPNEYYNWILFAQNGNYKELTSISEIGNTNIIKFTNNPVTISFDEADIVDIIIQKEFRNQGLGSSLINYALCTNNLKKLNLEVRENNINAIKFYEKLGFVKVRTIKNYYGNENAFFMIKVL